MNYDKHYYDGAWQPSSGTETIAVISSATEQEFSRVPRGGAADVDSGGQGGAQGLRIVEPPSGRGAGPVARTARGGDEDARATDRRGDRA
jgi:hypothetical protein